MISLKRNHIAVSASKTTTEGTAKYDDKNIWRHVVSLIKTYFYTVSDSFSISCALQLSVSHHSIWRDVGTSCPCRVPNRIHRRVLSGPIVSVICIYKSFKNDHRNDHQIWWQRYRATCSLSSIVILYNPNVQANGQLLDPVTSSYMYLKNPTMTVFILARLLCIFVYWNICPSANVVGV